MRTSQRLGLLLGCLWWAPTVAIAQSAKPVVAVFTIQDKTAELPGEATEQLTDYLTAQIAQGGLFRVVPSSRLKERLTAQKIESYKQCYDEKCQIDIGRELAAQKSLSTQIVKVGTKCAVVATFYDLRKATSESAASEKGGCAKDDIATLLERVAASLKSQTQLGAGPGVGGVLIRSEPPGAEVFLDGTKVRGTTPVSVPFVKEGEHALMVTKGDHRHVGKVKVVADQIATVSCTLQRVSAAAEQEQVERERRRVDFQRTVARVRADRRAKAIWGYATLGLSGAAAATVAVLYGVGFTQRKDADALYMASSSQQEMNGHWADVEAADRMIIAGHVMAGVAGAALVFSLYELLSRPAIPREGAADPPPVAVGPAGITVTARF